MEKPEKFDGNLVFIAHKQPTHEGQYYFHNESLGRFVPISDDLLHKLGEWHYKEGLGNPQIFKAHSLRKIVEARERSKKLQYPEAYEILEGGRLRIYLLLNSRGGKTSHHKAVTDSINYIKSKNGKVSAFGESEVCSAAAGLFMMAPKSRRFLAFNSSLIFHLNSEVSKNPHVRLEEGEEGKDDELEDDDGWQADQEILNMYHHERQGAEQHIRKLLLESATKKQREKMQAILDRAFNNPDKPDCPILFKAGQAAELGLAKAVFSLEKEFQKISGVDIDAYQDTGIDTFFDQHHKRIKENIEKLKKYYSLK